MVLDKGGRPGIDTQGISWGSWKSFIAYCALNDVTQDPIKLAVNIVIGPLTIAEGVSILWLHPILVMLEIR